MSLPTEMNSRFSQYSRLFIRRRRLFYLAIGLPLLFTILFTSIATPTFKAEGRLLPSQDMSNMGVIGILTGFFGSRGTTSQEGAPSSFLFEDILKSRTVIDSVLECEVDFVDRHSREKKGSLRSLLKYSHGNRGYEDFLNSNSARMDLETGIITLATASNDPYLSAILLNTWIEKLDDFNKKVRVTQAGENLKYLETRLEESLSELSAAQESLVNFLANNRGYPSASTPKIDSEVRRLTSERDLKEQIHQLLLQEFEMAKLTKRKTTPVVSVLDPGTPPTEKAGPKKLPVFAMSFVFALLILFIALFLLEANDPTDSTAGLDPREFKAAFSEDLSDLKSLIRRKK